MIDLSTEAEAWLPLSEAAKSLNVHPTTLRRWANNGDIPVMLTPGGHRRFAASDLEQFARERHGRQTNRDIEALWADQALTQTRHEIVVHGDEQWLTRFDADTRAQHRRLGRRLMGLTLRYLAATEPEAHLLEEAHALGELYGRLSLHTDLPLAEALQAAMFFRDTLVETAMQLPDKARIRPEANMRLLRRINTLLNTVHIAIAEVYDAKYTDSLPGTKSPHRAD